MPTAPESLSIARANSHTCTHIIPGAAFSQVGDGHWTAHVSTEEGPTSLHATGRSKHFNGCKDGFNTTTIHSVNISGNEPATAGISFYNQAADGKLNPQPTHEATPDARVHVDKTHGLTYHAVVPAGSTSPQTIYWKTHDYKSDDIAKVHAVANLDEPFRHPQTFEASGKKGVVFYKLNEDEPCVAQKILAQNPTEMGKLKKTTIANGKPTDGDYLEVPKSLHNELEGHVKKLEAAHEIVSASSQKPGMAIHLVGMAKPPEFVHVHVEHSTTPASQMPKAPAAASEFSIGTDGQVSQEKATAFELTPLGGTKMPTESAPTLVPTGGDDETDE